jgi:hypothetical protein
VRLPSTRSAVTRLSRNLAFCATGQPVCPYALASEWDSPEGQRAARCASAGVEVEFEDGLALVHFTGEPEAVLLVERDR